RDEIHFANGDDARVGRSDGLVSEQLVKAREIGFGGVGIAPRRGDRLLEGAVFGLLGIVLSVASVEVLAGNDALIEEAFPAVRRGLGQRGIGAALFESRFSLLDTAAGLIDGSLGLSNLLG